MESTEQQEKLPAMVEQWKPEELDCYMEFEQYDFDADEGFAVGARSLNLTTSEELLRAKAFYFQKQTGKSLDLDRFMRWKTSKSTPVPYPASFQEIMELVSKGHPVPGIKIIPNTVHGKSSEPTLAPPKKPWEST